MHSKSQLRIEENILITILPVSNGLYSSMGYLNITCNKIN
jgi:hypothetical protein